MLNIFCSHFSWQNFFNLINSIKPANFDSHVQQISGDASKASISIISRQLLNLLYIKKITLTKAIKISKKSTIMNKFIANNKDS